MDMNFNIDATWFVIIFIGALVQGATGFGFNLVVTPLLAVSVDETNNLIVLVLTLGLFLNGLMSWKLKKHADLSLIKFMIGASIIGSLLGSYLLNLWGDLAISKLLIAFFVTVFSLIIYFEISKPIRNEKLGGVVAGFFSGVFTTLTSFGGPPVALLLSNQKKDLLVFKGTISLYFLIKSIFSICILIIVTKVQLNVMISSLYFIPVIFLGWKIGYIIVNFISVQRFRLVVLLIIIAASIRIITTL